MEQECLFPTDAQAFLGRNDQEVMLHNCGEVPIELRAVTIVRTRFTFDFVVV